MSADKARSELSLHAAPGPNGPVFNEPWEARAFALAVQLAAAGQFSWAEWSDALAAEIRMAPWRTPDGAEDSYYAHWLAALERLCEKKEIANRDALADLKDSWRQAYLDTPHGQPVNLPAHRTEK